MLGSNSQTTATGEIELVSNYSNSSIYGSASADGDITISALNSSVNTGSQTIIYTGGDFNATGYNASIQGAIRAEGNININATNQATISSNSNNIDAAYDLTVLANDIRVENNTFLYGNNITIDPDNKLFFRGSAYADNQLTLNSGDLLNYGVIFAPQGRYYRSSFS